MKYSILLIDSTYPINNRNEKLIFSLRELLLGCQVDVVTWNRDLRLEREEKYTTHLYKVASPYGKALTKFKNLWGYYRYLNKINKALNPKIIIASHWDMLFIAALVKKKDQVLIYDDLDIPKSNNKLILNLLQFIERLSLIKTDIVILASRFYAPLYTQTNFDKIVVENKPIETTRHNRPSRAINGDLVVSYIGGVRYLPIMKNLVDAVKEIEGVKLEIHGEGYQLEELIAYTGTSDNIRFTGRYEYNTITKLYDAADVVWAVYPNKDYNVKYAISNKFHESLEFGVPCIYAAGTKLGDMVKTYNIGYTVNPYSVEEIAILLESLRDNRAQLENMIEKNKEFLEKELTWCEEIALLLPLLQRRIAG